MVIADKIDRISRLPLAEAEKMVESIQAKGARLAVPGLVDLSGFAAEADGVAKIVLDSMQALLLKLAQQMVRDDYETRRELQRQGVQLAKAAHKYAVRIPDTEANERIIAPAGACTLRLRTLDFGQYHGTLAPLTSGRPVNVLHIGEWMPGLQGRRGAINQHFQSVDCGQPPLVFRIFLVQLGTASFRASVSMSSVRFSE